jgi:hypothetical protein
MSTEGIALKHTVVIFALIDAESRGVQPGAICQFNKNIFAACCMHGKKNVTRHSQSTDV